MSLQSNKYTVATGIDIPLLLLCWVTARTWANTKYMFHHNDSDCDVSSMEMECKIIAQFHGDGI